MGTSITVRDISIPATSPGSGAKPRQTGVSMEELVPPADP